MQRVILHIGLPKAASTTIQKWAHTRRDALHAQGVHYPLPRAHSHDARHQNLVSGLLSGQQDWLRNTLAETTVPTLFLSAEGLSWHLQDYPEQHLAQFRQLLAPFETVLFINERASQRWVQSFYRQLVINPPNKLYNYATAQTLEEFKATKRVQFMLDRDSLVARAKASYGVAQVVKSDLEEDWAGKLCDVLGVKDMAEDLRRFPQKNIGFDSDFTEFARQVNAMELAPAYRAWAFKLFQDCSQSNIDVITYSQDLPSTEAELNQLANIVTDLAPQSLKQSTIQSSLLKQVSQLKKQDHK